MTYKSNDYKNCLLVYNGKGFKFYIACKYEYRGHFVNVL